MCSNQITIFTISRFSGQASLTGRNRYRGPLGEDKKGSSAGYTEYRHPWLTILFGNLCAVRIHVCMYSAVLFISFESNSKNNKTNIRVMETRRRKAHGGACEPSRAESGCLDKILLISQQIASVLLALH